MKQSSPRETKMILSNENDKQISSVVKEKLLEIIKRCKRRQVRCLEIFGSATSDEFDPAKSDLDFLVEYLEVPWGEKARVYLGLAKDLEKLFDRQIDLVMTGAIRNPYFLEAVNETRTTIYSS